MRLNAGKINKKRYLRSDDYAEVGQRTDTLQTDLSTDQPTDQRNPIEYDHGIQPKKVGFRVSSDQIDNLAR